MLEDIHTAVTVCPGIAMTTRRRMSNYQSSFHVIDLKLDIEPSLVYCSAGAVRVAQGPAQRPAAARCAVEHNDEYLCTGGRRGLP